MAIVWVPSQMRGLTAGQERVTAPGHSVGEVIGALEQSFPRLKARLCQDEQLSPHVAVVVDG